TTGYGPTSTGRTSSTAAGRTLFDGSCQSPNPATSKDTTTPQVACYSPPVGFAGRRVLRAADAISEGQDLQSGSPRRHECGVHGPVRPAWSHREGRLCHATGGGKDHRACQHRRL